MNPLVEFPGRDWPADVIEDHLPEPHPLEEMRQVADAIAERRASGVEAVFAEGRRHLQRLAVRELHRLVGELVVEVARMRTARSRIQRAFALGDNLVRSRPSHHIIRQCADPEDFYEQCDAACAALTRYIAAAVNEALVADGYAAVPDAEEWVRVAARQLQEEVAGNADDRIEREVELTRIWTAMLNLPPEPEIVR